MIIKEFNFILWCISRTIDCYYNLKSKKNFTLMVYSTTTFKICIKCLNNECDFTQCFGMSTKAKISKIILHNVSYVEVMDWIMTINQ